MDCPEELKYIATYLLRAKEVEAKDPIVSYYCRLFAVKLAVEKGATSKEAQAFILSLMDGLEETKVALADQEAIQNEMVGFAHVENFALKIFIKADNEDRAGSATKTTAKTFLVSSTFLEVLKTFQDGELDNETIQKIKYAKFKTADIMKAIKEGRAPSAGPPGEMHDTDDSITPTAATASSNFANTSTNAQTNVAKLPTKAPSAPDQKIPIHQPTAPSAPVNFSNLNTLNDDEEDESGYNEEDRLAISSAGRHAKFAMSALLYDDVKAAIENLEVALAKLRPLKIVEDLS